MLSLAPVDDGYRLDLGRLPMPVFGDISILPVPPIEGGALPWPPGYPSMPPLPFEPGFPFPPIESPDHSEAGGFTEIDNSDQNQPGILVEPASDKVTREVLQMLDSLRYIPNSHDSDNKPQSIRTTLRTQDAASAMVSGARHLHDVSEGGMIALVHDAVIVHSVAKDDAPFDAIDSWLNVPVRMDSAHGKFQAFEVSTGEIPSSPAPPSSHEAPFLAPLKSPSDLTPPAAIESMSQTSAPAENAFTGVPTTRENIVDLPSSLAMPLEPSNTTSSSKCAAAAIFALLAIRAVRAARTPDASESQINTTLARSHPIQPREAT